MTNIQLLILANAFAFAGLPALGRAKNWTQFTMRTCLYVAIVFGIVIYVAYRS